ncbi:MAG: toll/interleukin-1 receptor domain-containing protein [Chloroflexota bacterium]
MDDIDLTEMLMNAKESIDAYVFVGGLLVGDNQKLLMESIAKGVKVRFLFPSINSPWLDKHLHAATLPKDEYDFKIAINSGIARSINADVRFHTSPILSWFVVVDKKVVASKPIAFYEEVLPTITNSSNDVVQFTEIFERTWKNSSTFIEVRSLHTDKFRFPLRIFLCHSSNDKPMVRDIYQKLLNNGFRPWLDEKELLPGQDWNSEIINALRDSNVVILFLSKESVSKTGYLQKELRMAIDIAQEQPFENIFLIPAKLEECNIPLGLSGIQYVNLFEEDGYERLLKSLMVRHNQLNSG